MCLEINKETPKIAKKDIVCYKVLAKSDEKLVTPFFNCVMEPNHTYTITEPFDIRWAGKTVGIFLFSGCHNTLVVEGGGFHTFKHRIDAKWLARVMTRPRDFVILKCVIPKGTEYFKGVSEDMTCYVSKTLQTLEPIR